VLPPEAVDQLRGGRTIIMDSPVSTAAEGR
jgi:hypothetical protein